MSDLQFDLLTWTPPPGYRFGGATFDEARDRQRLSRQMQSVHDAMLDGKHRTLDQLSKDAGCPPASASARFRDLKRLGFDVQKENLGSGTWTYWMEKHHG